MLARLRDRVRAFMAPEVRQTSYSDTFAQALLAAASGEVRTSPASIGPLEAAAGLWARGLASAAVSPESAALRAVTPSVLAWIGRELVRRGEVLFVIDVTPAGDVALIPVGTWDVRGSVQRRDWWYRCDLYGPDQTDSISRPADAVVHVMYASDPARSWRGVAPLQWAGQTGRLAGALERMLADEAAGPVGHLLPIPEGAQPEGDDADADPLAELRAGIGSLKGKTALVETSAGGWGDRGQAPAGDYQTHRIGADWPAAVAGTRPDVALTVYAACGVPPSLVTMPADGTGQREAWRRFLHGTIAPIGRLIIEELQRKLDPAAALSFRELQAADVVARARAWRSLVGAPGADGAGRMPDADARAIVGF